MIDIKLEPELQHVLAHMLRAIQFLAEASELASAGFFDDAQKISRAALFECESIEGLITFDGDEDFVNYVGKRNGLQSEEAKVEEG